MNAEHRATIEAALRHYGRYRAEFGRSPMEQLDLDAKHRVAIDEALTALRALDEAGTLTGQAWEPLEDKAYTMPDGEYLATDGNRIIIKREPEEYIKLPSSVRLCKRTSKTLKKE